MKVELTHDIIAVKVWEKLPEQDKQLRLVRNSLQQRLLDYKKESGSLLGEKELIAWEDYFILMDLSTEQGKFIERSKEAIELKKKEEQEQRERELHLTRQKLTIELRARKRQRIFLIGLGILTLTAILLSIWATTSRQIAKEKEKEAEDKRTEAEEANFEARLRIADLAMAEYQNNLEDARKNRSDLNLEAAYSAAMEAKAVFSKYDLALIGTNISEDQVEEMKKSWDNNGAQIKKLLAILKKERPGFPEYQELTEKARQFENKKDYINALGTFRKAKNKLASGQVQNDIQRTIREGFSYYSKRGRGHFESGTKQDYQLAFDFFTKALQLKNDPEIRGLLEDTNQFLRKGEN